MSFLAMRVLVLTMYSGEGEFEECCRSVTAQRGLTTEHLVFDRLPNREAHDSLYRTIMDERRHFDFFVKLDADMALASEVSLARLVEPFQRWAGLDHLVAGVDDWMTGADMIGVHVFSPRVDWTEHQETLFVDPDPVFPGLQLVQRAPRPPVVRHAFDPTPLQAFHFGVHRGIQAVQRERGRAARRPDNAFLQIVVLERVWRRFVALGDRRLGLAVLGADMALQGTIKPTANDYAEPDLAERFAEVEKLDAADLHRRLRPRWGHAGRCWVEWWRMMEPSMRAAVLRRALRNGMSWPIRRVLSGRPRRPRTRWG